MATRTAERRRSTRMSACYIAIIRHGRRVLARGRTADISEAGVMVVARASRPMPANGCVFVDLIVPADPLAGTKCQVTYLCRVARQAELGNMVGLGLEFVQKQA